jgi:hypothetical protein
MLSSATWRRIVWSLWTSGWSNTQQRTYVQILRHGNIYLKRKFNIIKINDTKYKKSAIINSRLSHFHVLFRCKIYAVQNKVPSFTFLLQKIHFIHICRLTGITYIPPNSLLCVTDLCFTTSYYFNLKLRHMFRHYISNTFCSYKYFYYYHQQ